MRPFAYSCGPDDEMESGHDDRPAFPGDTPSYGPDPSDVRLTRDIKVIANLCLVLLEPEGHPVSHIDGLSYQDALELARRYATDSRGTSHDD